MKVYSRLRWGARRPRDRTPQELTDDSILFFHYSEGQGRGIESFKEQAAAIRGIQNFHMDVRQWSDIAYNRLICQPYGKLRRARCFEGRGLDTVPASQVGHNTGNVSYCILAKPGEPLKKATRKLMVQAAKEHKGKYIAGHRDGGDTDCPGDLIYAALDGVAKEAGRLHWKGHAINAPTPAPKPPTPAPKPAEKPTPAPKPKPAKPEFKRTVKRGSTGTQVRLWQERLGTLGYPVKVDGQFGKQTEERTRQFQTNKKLSVDGIVGRKTWARAFG